MCFFVAHKIHKREAKIAFYPAEDMLEDFSTKPTQGSLFVRQRNALQVIDEKYFLMHGA